MSHTELPKLRKRIRDQLDDLFTGDKAESLILDGWDSSSKHSLLNFLLASLLGEEFLDDLDVTGKEKNSAFMAEVILEYIAKVKAQRGKNPDIVCTDNPSVMKDARAKVEEEEPYIHMLSCAIHGVSKGIEDFCAFPTIAQLIKDHDFINKKIRNKQFLHAELLRVQKSPDLRQLYTEEIAEEQRDGDPAKGRTYTRFAPKTVVRRGATRMGSAVAMLERNALLQPAFDKVVSHPEYHRRCGIAQRRAGMTSDQVAAETTTAREAFEHERGETGEEARLSSAERQRQYILLKELVRNEGKWELTHEVIALLKPLILFLKDLDSQQPMMGDIYYRWQRLTKDFEEGDSGIDGHFAKYAEDDYVSEIPFEEREQFQQKAIDRWNYMHAPLHSFAFCLNPALHFLDHFADDEVQRDFRTCALKFAEGDAEVATRMETEFLLYSEKEGPWSDPSIWVQARQLAESGQQHLFWKRHGDKARSLREPGVKSQTGVGTAGGAERNWSAHDLILTKRRSRMQPSTMANWVFCFSNLNLLDKLERKKYRRKRHIVRYDYPATWEEMSASEEEDA
ncbi:hypothetical protein CYMTET_54648 [Cymbomonas tetramitiformis]|uniref:DUF659 domain-containing protein n=1 Tax=Cymbomonas tetramitiformis TaxID=36881 RepID=A0AAE0BG99_9CHLO|nr:hypothetical protein CYMTET_54648 [Cymbomonas tetramitiformis]|eukprot:gene23499-28451_t